MNVLLILVLLILLTMVAYFTHRLYGLYRSNHQKKATNETDGMFLLIRDKQKN